MRYGTIDGIEQAVSRLILGGVKFSRATQERSFAILDRYIAAGGNAVDTAPVYNDGESEEVIGAWLKQRGRRDDFVIITKGAAPAETDAAGQPAWIHRVDPESIEMDLSASLERLGIESIDLYLLHRDDPSVPVETIIDCLDQKAREGRIRAFGCSNWTHQRIAEANSYAADHNLRRIVASSPQFSLAVAQANPARDAVYVGGDGQAIAWYRDNDIPLLPWSSQAKGWFTAQSPRGTPRSTSGTVDTFGGDDNRERRRRAREVAARLGCSPNQVALAWLLHLPMRVLPLVGVFSAAHLADTLGSLDVQLTEGEVAWLNLET